MNGFESPISFGPVEILELTVRNKFLHRFWEPDLVRHFRLHPFVGSSIAVFFCLAEVFRLGLEVENLSEELLKCQCCAGRKQRVGSNLPLNALLQEPWEL